MNDPNFPEWAQWVVLGIGGSITLVVIGVIGFAIIVVASWINSGSH